MHRTQYLTKCLAAAALVLGSIAFTGCERKEKILEIETPSGKIEVERSIDTGEVDVEITDN